MSHGLIRGSWLFHLRPHPTTTTHQQPKGEQLMSKTRKRSSQSKAVIEASLQMAAEIAQQRHTLETAQTTGDREHLESATKAGVAQ
jgi:hypothetical protein